MRGQSRHSRTLSHMISIGKVQNTSHHATKALKTHSHFPSIDFHFWGENKMTIKHRALACRRAAYYARRGGGRPLRIGTPTAHEHRARGRKWQCFIRVGPAAVLVYVLTLVSVCGGQLAQILGGVEANGHVCLEGAAAPGPECFGRAGGWPGSRAGAGRRPGSGGSRP